MRSSWVSRRLHAQVQHELGRRDADVAGEYTLALKWKDEGAPEIEVKVLSGKNVVAAATGTRVVLDNAALQDAVVFQLDGQGGRELSRILSGGRRDAIRFETTWTAKSK